MSIKQLLNPAEEEVYITRILQVEELHEQAVVPNEQGPDELEAEKESEPTIPLPDQVEILRKAIRIVVDANSQDEILNFFRKLNLQKVPENGQKKDDAHIQTCLASFIA
jgi:hypothetical protein